jgi:hypothetical protein
MAALKLTFPGYEPGAVAIRADGVQVGHILANFHMEWTAHLWRVAGRPGEGFAGEVEGGKLAPLRELLRQRVADQGPWWAVEAVKGAARETVA